MRTPPAVDPRQWTMAGRIGQDADDVVCVREARTGRGEGAESELGSRRRPGAGSRRLSSDPPAGAPSASSWTAGTPPSGPGPQGP